MYLWVQLCTPVVNLLQGIKVILLVSSIYKYINPVGKTRENYGVYTRPYYYLCIIVIHVTLRLLCTNVAVLEY
jgi:hypothetical protein